MRRVVLVNQSTGYLMIDIVNAYADVYDEVVLLAGSIREMDRSLNPTVKVYRLVKYDRTTPLKRIYCWCVASVQAFFLLWRCFPKHEIVYVTNPPMAYLSSLLLRKRPFSLIVYDAYPDALKNIGIGERNVLYKLWERWNRVLFRRAAKITTLSQGMAGCLAKYGDLHKVQVVPNWVASEKLMPIEKQLNSFRIGQGLSGKFVVMYSGNIGYTHHVEAIIDMASALRHREDVFFMIIGEGRKKQDLMDRADAEGLQNCRFLGWQSKDVFPQSLAAADLAIVTLNEETGTLSVPSKTYNLLAVGAPLLCIAPEVSELATLIKRHKNGACFSVNKLDDMVHFITDLADDVTLCEHLSMNSKMASAEYTHLNAKLYI